jgi:ABC-2 type transport system permease protein
MLLGGVLLPIELYPPWAQPLLRWLPFANVASGPARALVAPDWHDLPLLLLRQSCCALVFGLGVWLTYRLAVRRVFVNGG